METIYFVLITAYFTANGFLIGTYYESECEHKWIDLFVCIFTLFFGVIVWLWIVFIDLIKWINVMTQAEFYFNYLRGKYDSINNKIFINIYRDWKTLTNQKKERRLTLREIHFMHTVCLVLAKNDLDYKKRKSIDETGNIYE